MILKQKIGIVVAFTFPGVCIEYVQLVKPGEGQSDFQVVISSHCHNKWCVQGHLGLVIFVPYCEGGDPTGMES